VHLERSSLRLSPTEFSRADRLKHAINLVARQRRPATVRVDQMDELGREIDVDVSPQEVAGDPRELLVSGAGRQAVTEN